MSLELYTRLFKLSARNIRRRGKRTWLTVIGVLIGVAAIIALVSLGQGLEASIVEEFEDLGADNIYVSPSGGELTDSDIQVIERAQGVDTATGSYTSTAEASFRGDTQNLNIQGVNPRNIDVFMSGQGLEINRGRELRPNDVRNGVIGARVVDDTFEQNPGIRSQIDIQDERYTTIGILAEAGDPQFERTILIPLDSARNLFDADDSLTQITVRIQTGFELDEVQDNIEEEMRRDRNLQEGDEDFDLTTAQDILDSLTTILAVVQGIVVGIASIALLVGGIGIMNTMYMSITERTREIGVMKAIGARKKHITSVFLFEAGIIGTIGSLIGLVIGLGLSNGSIYIINEFTDFRAVQVYSPELVLGAIFFGFFLGVVSGILPSWKAANMDPAESLRYE